jgi:hypothetical protein
LVKLKIALFFLLKILSKNIRGAILSNVKDPNGAIACFSKHGPQFGHDINIYSSDESADYSRTSYKNNYYEKKIRNIEGTFSMEDYEIFQIIRPSRL